MLLDARMLVLGDESHPALSRLVTGSVVAPVAAHAPVPVVAVPANWDDAPVHDVVVVGVKDRESSSLIRHGFQEAASRKARLVILHAWEFLAQWDEFIANHADLPDWEKRVTEVLTETIDQISPDFPGVESEIRLQHGQPAQTLVDASAEADLVLVTRRPHILPFGHLGATGRAVLRETRCPTFVFPPAAEPVDLPSSVG